MSGCFQRFLVMSSLVSLGAASSAGKAPTGAARPALQITVRVQNYARVPSQTLSRAEMTAGNIFLKAGIETVWLDCPTAVAEQDQYPACQQPMGLRDLVLRIHRRPPVELSEPSNGFGMAFLSGKGGFARIASVFFDRVEKLTWETLRPSTEGIFAIKWPLEYYTATTLGVVMAHEIGHLLLGSGSHFRHGIMRASFRPNTLQEAFRGLLRFTPSQVKRLRADVRARVRAEEAS